jgi:addiction module HigA family antidote
MSSESLSTFSPNWVSSPGETILDVLEERGWSQAEFAVRVGFTKKHVNKLVNGSASISDDTAIRLERVLGGTASFWLTREAHYRESLARIDEAESLQSQVSWLDELPLSHMVKFDWVKRCRDKADQVAECLRFFGVASVDAWRKRYERPIVAFKASETQRVEPGPAAAWLRKCEIEAGRIESAPFDAKGFRNALKEIRELSREQRVEVFVPQLVELCASVGVAVVFVPSPKGCPVTGATKWLTSDKPLLALSLRFKSNDHLWFAFFHEAGHILLHGKKLVFLEFNGSHDREMEDEADRFAQDQLIPPKLAKDLEYLGHSQAAICEFADRARIAPGIVVGRLQKHFGLPWKTRLNKLKARYEWKSN